MVKREPVAGVLYTVGHSNTPAEALLAKLQAWSVSYLVDVRRYPSSRWNPQFNGPVLARWLGERGVGYRHEVDLGGHREAAPESPHTALEPAFQAYADHMRSAPFHRAINRLVQHATGTPTAVMCAEAAPERCHRRFLADAVTVRGLTVRHILSPTEAPHHQLHPQARRDGDDLVYPATEAAQLELF